jgi:hypothetical protein
VTSNELAKGLCEAFGIDIEGVRKVTITAEVDKVVTITVERSAVDAQLRSGITFITEERLEVWPAS